MKQMTWFLVLALMFAPTRVNAQEQASPIDGAAVLFQDDLLDKLVGQWRLTGIIMGKNANHSVDVEWVLNHQFIRIHEKTIGDKQAGRPYEAIVFVGYDHASERYVAHWLDVFGGRFSETLGYGTRSGNSVEFVFEYPDGPFHTTFSWNAESGTWTWLMRTKNSAGKWIEFGRMGLAKTSGNIFEQDR